MDGGPVHGAQASSELQVCEVTSYLSGGQNIPQISWGCESPTLSDKSEFPLVYFSVTMVHDCAFAELCPVPQFSRTVAPEPSKGPALTALMSHYRVPFTKPALNWAIFRLLLEYGKLAFCGSGLAHRP